MPPKPAPPRPAPKKAGAPTAAAAQTPAELAAAAATYGRGERVATKTVKDKKLRTNLKKLELRYRDAAAAAKSAELLRPEQGGGGYMQAEGELERTWRVGQDVVRSAVDVASAQKGFALALAGGPYAADYTRDGRYLLLGGRKGHVATMDWREGKLGTELQLKETVRDVKWLHNDSFFAAAQKKYVYIYDRQGVEIHCLKKHIEVTHMEFLPYHFLLATIGNAGYLKYQDTSTGTLVAELRTKLGAPTALAQNRRNAILHVGHGNGQVTLWSPNLATPLVTMQAHRGPVRAAAIDRGGHYMATAGADARMNIFDIRMYREVHSYFTPVAASALAISDTGLVGVGWGGHVALWKDALRAKARDPYLAHHEPGRTIAALRFCPLDDVLGAGHDGGFSSLIVPGAGEPNFDALEANPYATAKDRREAEVRALLEKLRPEMIALDPEFIGRVDTHAAKLQNADADAKARERALADRIQSEDKNRMRGKNSALRKHLRKKNGKFIMDERRDKLLKLKAERSKRRAGEGEHAADAVGEALGRFVKK